MLENNHDTFDVHRQHSFFRKQLSVSVSKSFCPRTHTNGHTNNNALRLNANAWYAVNPNYTPFTSSCCIIVQYLILTAFQLLLLLYVANCWMPETFHSYYSRIMLVPFRVKWKLLLFSFHFQRTCICHLFLCFPLCCHRYSDRYFTLSHRTLHCHRCRYISFVSIASSLLLQLLLLLFPHLPLDYYYYFCWCW